MTAAAGGANDLFSGRERLNLAVELPIMQPAKIRLAINLKTAMALGFSIPEALLACANEVIQWPRCETGKAPR